VENIEGLFGAEDGDDVDEEVDGNYKRQDLLKMHAYRDAIKRSQGAYILYPGRSVKPVRFSGFHEILPGLGAFGVSPDESGKAQGMEELTRFLDEAVAHLCDRATARERSGYHLAQSYKNYARVGMPPWLMLPERDLMSDGSIALPPAEHLVLVAMRCDSSQLAWTLDTSLAVVRLGKVGGDWRMLPEWSGLRHIVLRANGAPDARGLWRIAKSGYRIMSGADLAAIGCPATSTADLHAVFDVEPKLDFPAEVWSLKALLRAIRACETSSRRVQSDPLRRKSLFPRLASLAGLSRG
jgi:hypothetical protein